MFSFIDDSFFFSSGGTKVTFWSFRQEEIPNNKKPSAAKNHTGHITCLCISRDGTIAATGNLNKITFLCTHAHAHAHAKIIGQFFSLRRWHGFFGQYMADEFTRIAVHDGRTFIIGHERCFGCKRTVRRIRIRRSYC